jgi:hypothetical protein
MAQFLRHAVFILALVACFSCYRAAPTIYSIEPQIAEAGGTVSISGKNFGREREESFVSFDGVAPTLSSYTLWSDDLIVVRIPDFGESGLVHVHRNGKKSNPALFSTRDDMPVVPELLIPVEPLIEAVEPAEASPGKLLTIKGINFGSLSGETAVLFSSNTAMTVLNNDSIANTEFIKVRATSNDFISWTKNEVQVRVPDGTVSGDILLLTQKAESNRVRLVISGTPGSKVLKNKKTFVLNYSVNVHVEKAQRPNSLFIDLPVPADTAFQRNRGAVAQSNVPFADNYYGTSLYRFNDLEDGISKEIKVSYLVDVYAIESRPEINQIKSASDMSGKQRYVAESFFIESDTPDIKTRALDIIRRETNPYLKARSIFRALLQEKDIDGFSAAKYFCELCRAAGVPALPVAGVLIVQKKIALAHLWSMIWIDNLGWLPVDIAAARGDVPEGFDAQPNAEYYFGNVDSNRIVFSFGEAILPPMFHNGKTASGGAKYALQNIMEESSGGISEYSTLWSDIEITGVY